MLKYPKNIYFIDYDDIIELSKWDNAQIGNVVRGLHEECYIILSENNLKTIRFDYINGSNKLTGRGIEITFNHNRFYDELLLFCVYISKEFNKNDPLGIYYTFTGHLRTILEQNDYLTILSSELNKYKDGFIMGPQKIEIIKIIEKRDFFKEILKPNHIKVKDNKTYLYLALNEDTNLFKIGYSKNPIFREKTLQSQEPNIFNIKIWECERKVETKMHRLFREKRVRGEWFNLNIDDLIELNNQLEIYSISQ